MTIDGVKDGAMDIHKNDVFNNLLRNTIVSAKGLILQIGGGSNATTLFSLKTKLCHHDVISIGSTARRGPTAVYWPTDFCIGGIPKGENYVICPFANFAAPAMGWKLERLFESFDV